MADIRTTISAFSEDHAARLTGCTKSQLRNWDKEGLYSPTYGRGSPREAFSRIYSFRDIVALRVLSVLRNTHRVPLARLRDVGEMLSSYGDDRWTAVRLYALNGDVVWRGPGGDQAENVVDHQNVMPEVMQAIIAETSRDIDRMMVRDPDKVGKIERSRHNNQNQPVIGGTRIPVATIQRFADAGYTTAQILEEYPDLTQSDIDAALSYKRRAA